MQLLPATPSYLMVSGLFVRRPNLHHQDVTLEVGYRGSGELFISDIRFGSYIYPVGLGRVGFRITIQNIQKFRMYSSTGRFSLPSFINFVIFAEKQQNCMISRSDTALLCPKHCSTEIFSQWRCEISFNYTAFRIYVGKPSFQS